MLEQLYYSLALVSADVNHLFYSDEVCVCRQFPEL